MRFRYITIDCFILIISFLFFLQANNKIVDCPNKRTIEDDAIKIVSYLALFKDAHEKYLSVHKIEPEIRCKKCATKRLTLGEFEGGLVGVALKNLADGKDNFEKTKLILDGCLKVVLDGIFLDIIDYMVRISNETQQVCSHCQGPSTSWEKID